MKNLDVLSLPLGQRHIIEASAGTGKTFNITRIYLRLLLQKRLRVQDILVVTFTQAATEELKGRVAKELKAARTYFESLKTVPQSSDSNEFLESVIHSDEVRQTLPSFAERCHAFCIVLDDALLHLDEAAIFTIHGFCSKMLAQHNLLAGLPFDITLNTDTKRIALQACEDEYRRLISHADLFTSLTASLATAESFIMRFSSLIFSQTLIESGDKDRLIAQVNKLKQQGLAALAQHLDLISKVIIEPSKDQEKRRSEFEEVQRFLELPVRGDEDIVLAPKALSDFFHGRNFKTKSSDEKQQLKVLAEQLKSITKDWLLKWKEKCEQAALSQLYKQIITAIRLTLSKEKDKRNELDFNDLITQLKDALIDPQNQLFVATIAEQYPAILVDEFQDTDPDQYQIFDTIQAHNEDHLLLMIGDPKQAIYSFRGGDIYTYLKAKNQAQYHWCMDTNWRSSGPMVTAYNQLFYGKETLLTEPDMWSESLSVFGSSIAYAPVKAAREDELNIVDPDSDFSALSLLWFDHDDAYGKKANNQSFKAVMAAYCAKEIKRLLFVDSEEEADATPKQNAVLLSEKGGDITKYKYIDPSDIAILVRDKVEAQSIQQALTKQKLSSVYLSNRDNIFYTPEAKQLFRFMQGVYLADEPSKFTAALSTQLFGLNAHDLARLRHNEQEWEMWRDRVMILRQLWTYKGFISMAFFALHQYANIDVLDKDRQLTNYIQLIELVQAQSQTLANPMQVIDWLHGQIFEPMGLTSSDVELRLESDDNLIRIVTLHGSKGLEYPIVFVPFVTRSRSSKKAKASYQIYNSDKQRSEHHLMPTRDVQKLSESQQGEEDIRLLYVAITRAVYRCYLGITPFDSSQNSPLGLTLGLKSNDDLMAEVKSLADRQASISYNEIEGSDDNELVNDTIMINEHLNLEHGQEPKVADLNQSIAIEQNWMLHSFSSLSHHRHGHFQAQDIQNIITGANLDHKEIDEPFSQERPLTPAIQQLNQALLDDSKKLCFTFAKGAQSGLILHDILENIDFCMPNEEVIQQSLKSSLVNSDELDFTSFMQWLNDCLSTPLQQTLSDLIKPNIDSQNLTLAELSPDQCLKEVTFYFPVAAVSLNALGAFLSRYRGESQPIFLGKDKIKGMMNGIIDLIFEWQGKYYVADYKSNYLGNAYQHYDMDSMNESMRASDYDLQYLIYALALHRYLKQRLDGYLAEQHFGGVYYMYLRGMHPSHLGNGVYYHKLDLSVLDELDSLFSQ